MDQRSQERLDEILKKEPEALNFEEKAFLRARRGYLKKVQLEEYKEVLENVEVKPEAPKTALEGYKELLNQAKALGYKGKRLRRPELEDFIRQRNPFK